MQCFKKQFKYCCELLILVVVSWKYGWNTSSFVLLKTHNHNQLFYLLPLQFKFQGLFPHHSLRLLHVETSLIQPHGTKVYMLISLLVYNGFNENYNFQNIKFRCYRSGACWYEHQLVLTRVVWYNVCLQVVITSISYVYNFSTCIFTNVNICDNAVL